MRRSDFPCVRHPQPLLALPVEPYLRAFKVAIHGHYAIFPPLVVRFVSSCMFVVFSVKRAPVLKRSSENAFQNSAILMHTVPNGCKKPSASLGSRKEAKQERIREVSSASVGVVIRTCVWFTSRDGLLDKSHTSLVWTIGLGNAGDATEP